MNLDAVREIADAVMYEGYLLYPYRATSVKNRQRWTFGGLYPEAYAQRNGGSSSLQAQMLMECEGEPELSITVRFLHLLEHEDGLQEGVPREVGMGTFHCPATSSQRRMDCDVAVSDEVLSTGLHRITLRVRNLTDGGEPMSMMASTHAIIQVKNGRFLSQTDPGDAYRQAANECVNLGVWPVLAGDPASRSIMLVSPIILYDYPQIAPESAGNLFDGTEIDEILTLRILTLTDQEKAEMRAADPHTRRILERSENLSRDEMMKLHGVLRSPHAFDRSNEGAR